MRTLRSHYLDGTIADVLFHYAKLLEVFVRHLVYFTAGREVCADGMHLHQRRIRAEELLERQKLDLLMLSRKQATPPAAGRNR